MLLPLDGEGTLYEQTYRALRAAIESGVLPLGSKLPSSRTLSRDAQLSRNTVLQAFEALAAEGYAISRPGAGTFVADALPEHRADADSAAGRARRKTDPTKAPRLSGYGERILGVSSPAGISWRFRQAPLPYDFRYGEPAYDDFPLATWSRILSAAVRSASTRDLGYGEPGGDPELRESLAGYLSSARGVDCRPEQVVITHGAQQAIDLAARVLVDANDRVAVEDPGYLGFRHALRASGANVVPVPVDDEGLDVAALARLAGPDTRLVCVTPSHQFPIGALMPLERRLALLDWAEETGAIVVEDDYDSEFRFDGPPIESLYGLDRGDRVLYVGTFSKIVFPSLRLGYFVAPGPLHEPLLTAKAISDTGTAALEQRALSEFVRGGHWGRHLRRARTRMAARRAALLEALDASLGDRAVVSGGNAGLHVVVWLPDFAGDMLSEIRSRAAALGVGVYGVAPFYTTPPSEVGLLLGYAPLSEDGIREGVTRLARALALVSARS